MGSVRVAIVGVGNCAASLVQGVEYYKDADPSGTRARPDARAVRRLPRPRRRVRRRVRRRRQEGRPGPRPRRSCASENNTIKICRRPADRRHRAARPHPRRPRQVLPRDHHRVRRRAGRRRRRRCADAQADVLVCYLPVGSEDAAKFYAQCAIDAGVGVRQRAARSSSPATRSGPTKFEDAGVPDRRRRHQVAGRRHHHPPRAGQAVRGPRRHPRPHLPAQRRRQHGLQEHARARPPGVEEDLQDAVGHLAARRTTSAARNVHIGPSRLRRRGSTTASGPTSASRVARSATSR